MPAEVNAITLGAGMLCILAVEVGVLRTGACLEAPVHPQVLFGVAAHFLFDGGIDQRGISDVIPRGKVLQWW